MGLVTDVNTLAAVHWFVPDRTRQKCQWPGSSISPSDTSTTKGPDHGTSAGGKRVLKVCDSLLYIEGVDPTGDCGVSWGPMACVGSNGVWGAGKKKKKKGLEGKSGAGNKIHGLFSARENKIQTRTSLKCVLQIRSDISPPRNTRILSPRCGCMATDNWCRGALFY